MGKGTENRVFTHLKDKPESSKVCRTREVRDLGQEPKIEILTHGMETDSGAARADTSVFDLLRVSNLTNITRGIYSKLYGCTSVEEVVAGYGQQEGQDHGWNRSLMYALISLSGISCEELPLRA